MNELNPTLNCIICTEPFSKKHPPVALRCCHIFGHECIKKWLRNGSGNTNSCPICRHAIFDHTNLQVFDAASIWQSLCAQQPEQLDFLLTALWVNVRRLWNGRLVGSFTTTELLQKAVFPALRETAVEVQDCFLDGLMLITATWDSLGRPDSAQGLAVPLVRLARLMSQASSVLPKWLTSVPRMNLLFWQANAELGMDEQNVTWSHIEEAARLDSGRFLPLLHLYTILISQSIVHTETSRDSPKGSHENRNWVVDRCCKRIGGDWEGTPSGEFKHTLVQVFEALRRFQLQKGSKSLRGHCGEENIVRGLWSMAAWTRGRME